MNWRDKAVLFASAALLVASTGCSADATDLDGRGANGGNGPTDGTGDETTGGTTTPGDTTPPPTPLDTCFNTMKSYKGLGGVELTSERAKAEAGVERFRLKPFSSLEGEFVRVMGKTPASLAGSQDAFGKQVNRWFAEPLSSAITTFTSYRVAFDSALLLTNADAKYATAPTDASAATECGAFIRKAWSRTASPAEIDACKAVAITDTAAEPDAKRRWAYAFAAVLGSAGFTTY